MCVTGVTESVRSGEMERWMMAVEDGKGGRGSGMSVGGRAERRVGG